MKVKPLRTSRLYKLWDQVHSSYWFVPALMVLLSMMLALLLIIADHRYTFNRTLSSSWLFLGKAESARVILSTIATVMITIVSLTFSITIVVLTLASSQFGPRLIYNFMRDRNSQMALGVFLACFVFCLMILRAVQSDAAGSFVPQLGTTAAMVFALLSVGMLIFYIHHIADSIHSSRIIANVREELEQIVNRLVPERSRGDGLEEPEWQRLMALIEGSSLTVTARDRGVLQAIDEVDLLDWAEQHDLLIRLYHRPGEFIIRGTPLFEVYPRERVPKHQLDVLHTAFRFGHQRTLVQDIEFAFQQLVEIALRALSPGINDPYTAISCVDELGSGLALIARRGSQPRICRSRGGMPRMLIKAVDFAGLASIAFDQVRQFGAAHTAVMIRMLEVIEAVASTLDDEQQRRVLRRHADAIRSAAVESARHPDDRDDIDTRFERVVNQLGNVDGASGDRRRDQHHA